ETQQKERILQTSCQVPEEAEEGNAKSLQHGDNEEHAPPALDAVGCHRARNIHESEAEQAPSERREIEVQDAQKPRRGQRYEDDEKSKQPNVVEQPLALAKRADTVVCHPGADRTHRAVSTTAARNSPRTGSFGVMPPKV